MRLRPTRRTVLGTALGAGAGALLAAPVRPRAAAAAPTVVDIHCHTFNGADLPITGFLAHFVPGLSDVSRELTVIPETIVRRIGKYIHDGLNRVAPDGAAELAYLARLKASNKVAEPVAFLPDPSFQARYQQILERGGRPARRLAARFTSIRPR